MKTNKGRKRDSCVSSETPRGDQNLKATGKGESKRKGNNLDDNTYVSDGRRGLRSSRGFSNKKKKNINSGTWNVRTMKQMGKLQLLLQELNEYQMNIIGLCEMRWSAEGLFTSGDQNIVYCGSEQRNKRSSNCP